MPTSLLDGLGEAVLDIFAEECDAIFKPSIGGSQPIQGIFNARYREGDNLGKPVGEPNPRFWFRTGLIDAKERDIIEINGVDYIIRKRPEPDGLELSELILTEPT